MSSLRSGRGTALFLLRLGASVLALLVLPTGLAAQNLLVNPDVPASSGLLGWQAFDGFFPPPVACTSALTCAAFSVVPVDCCAGNPENGVSARPTASNAERYLLQCLPVTAGTSYEYGAWTRRTDGPLQNNGRPKVSVVWFGGAACSGAAITTDSVTTDAVPWELLQGVAAAPLGAVSAEFRLDVGTVGLNGNPATIDFAAPFLGVDGTVQAPPRIPALGGLGMVALVLTLAGVGLFALRRR